MNSTIHNKKNTNKFALIAGNANPPLCEKITQWYHNHDIEAGILQPDMLQRRIERFNDGEYWIELHDNIRGRDVFYVQPTQKPVNESLMELLIMLDAIRRSSPQRITAVLPYFGYARQDRKSTPRSPISAKLVSKIIEQAGADRIVTVDLHANQIQGFFDIPVDNLYASPILANHLNKHQKHDKLVIVSPDVGGVARARAFAKYFGCDLAIIDKRRPKAGVAEVMNIIGDVEGAYCVLVDDICDSAGTLCRAADKLSECGAYQVDAYITHGVFSANAINAIETSSIRKLVVTDTIYQHPSLHDEDKHPIYTHKKIEYVTIAHLLAEAIHCIHTDQSVSQLFDYDYFDGKI